MLFHKVIIPQKSTSFLPFFYPRFWGSLLLPQGIMPIFQPTRYYHMYQDKVLTFCTDFLRCFFFTISTAPRRHFRSPARQIMTATVASRRSAKVAISLFNAQAESSPPVCPTALSRWAITHHRLARQFITEGNPPCALNRS